MACSLQKLVSLMETCQADTLRLLNIGAAARLANWQRYEDDQEALVRFVHDRLLLSRANGYRLELKSGLSLERIVAYECPEIFSAEDREIALATLSGIGL
jgi:hypothetical protein